jgi:antitoxin MazE
MKAQVVKWGRSLAVRIPKPVVKKARLKEGDVLKVDATTDGQIKLRRAGRVLTLAQLVARITPGNCYGEISIGSERGKELTEC